MHLGLKIGPLCPILWCKVMGALALHRSSRLPSDSGSQHNLDPKKGAHINLIRDAPFPEPSFICLSKGPVNEPPPVSLRGGALWRELPVSRAFSYMSYAFLNKSSPNKKNFHPSFEGPRKRASPHILQNRGPMETDVHFQSLIWISFGVPRKGAFPPGSPHRAPTERDAPFPEPSLIHISKFPVYEPPFTFPNNWEALDSERLTLNRKTATSTALTPNEVLFTRSIIITIIIVSSLAAEAASIIWPRSLFGP